MTVFVLPEPGINLSTLVKELERLLKNDDVFTNAFLSNVIFCYKSSVAGGLYPEQHLEPAAQTWLENVLHVNSFEFAGAQSWLSGPYFVSGGVLHQAWKLYPDDTEAFYASVVPDPEDLNQYVPTQTIDFVANSKSFLPLSISAFESVGTVAVPSRLLYPISSEKPMNGFRIAVKDIFDLHGVRTAASNRAFRDLYPPRNKTASAVQRLINQGAIVVGKTKTTTLADRELATSDWIDTHSPFNSRGDGYIWRGGSSTGSAAAVAAYSWLDCAVGSDSEIFYMEYSF